MKVLDRINRTGTTVVMATHDAAIVDSIVAGSAPASLVSDENPGRSAPSRISSPRKSGLPRLRAYRSFGSLDPPPASPIRDTIRSIAARSA